MSGPSDSFSFDPSVVLYSMHFHRVRKILNLIKTPYTLKYKLMYTPPLPTWVDSTGRIALLGDACHAMLVSTIFIETYNLLSIYLCFTQPYRAQGAAMAIEDADVLGSLFSRISSHEEIAPLLRAYESIRRDRATATQRISTALQAEFHFSDGPEQEKRDRAFKLGMRMKNEMNEHGIDKAEELDAEAQAVLDGMNEHQRRDDDQFGYDVGEMAESWWRDNGAKILAGLSS